METCIVILMANNNNFKGAFRETNYQEYAIEELTVKGNVSFVAVITHHPCHNVGEEE